MTKNTVLLEKARNIVRNVTTGLFTPLLGLAIFAAPLIASNFTPNVDATVICNDGYVWNGTSCSRDETSLKLCLNVGSETGGVLQPDGQCLITDRVLPYQNATGLRIRDAQVTDPAYSPAIGWSLVPNTIRNTWGGVTVPLDNSLFGPTGITAAPSAGLFGQPNNLTVGTLPIPISDTFRYIGCERDYVNLGMTDRFVSSIAGSNASNPNCPGGAAEDALGTVPLSAAGRYLNYSICVRNFYNATTNFPNQIERHVGNFWSFNPTPVNHVSCEIAEYTENGFIHADLLENRFLSIAICSRDLSINSTNYREFQSFIRESNFDPSFNPAGVATCGAAYPDLIRVDNADMFDPNKPNQGNITYSLTRQAVCPSAPFGETLWLPSPTIPTVCVRTLTLTPTGYIPDQPGNITATSINSCVPALNSNLVIGETATCNFALSGAPAGTPYTAPNGVIGFITTGAPVNCTIIADTLRCENMPTTGGTVGIQDVRLVVNTTAQFTMGQYNLVAPIPPAAEPEPTPDPEPTPVPTPVADEELVFPRAVIDYSQVEIICEPALVDSTTSCYFIFPSDVELPLDTRIGIGDAELSDVCYFEVATDLRETIRCNNVPTGSVDGNIPVYAYQGSTPRVQMLGSALINPRPVTPIPVVRVLPRTGGESITLITMLFTGVILVGAVISTRSLLPKK